MDLTGFLTINGTDVWTEYGAFLGETEEGGHVNMDALLQRYYHRRLPGTGWGRTSSESGRETE